MCGRWYSCDTLFQRLAQHFEHAAPELGPFVQKQDAVVRQRHLARQGDLATPDQPDIGDGVMRGAKRARGDHRGTRAGRAGHARDARGVDSFRGASSAKSW